MRTHFGIFRYLVALALPNGVELYNPQFNPVILVIPVTLAFQLLHPLDLFFCNYPG